jgi:hypothetical protein
MLNDITIDREAIIARNGLLETERELLNFGIDGMVAARRIIADVDANFGGKYYGRGDRAVNNAALQIMYCQAIVDKFKDIPERILDTKA